MKLAYLISALTLIAAVSVASAFWNFGFGSGGPPPAREVPASLHGPSDLPAGVELDIKTLHKTRKALSDMERHLRRCDLYVDRQASSQRFVEPGIPPQACYTILLELKDGTRLETRRRTSGWDALDRSMASTVRTCFKQYRQMRERHKIQGPVREIHNF
ncbi:MAG: hypothetical protein V3573_02415 [Desulfovibrionaceae bacterium]